MMEIATTANATGNPPSYHPSIQQQQQQHTTTSPAVVLTSAHQDYIHNIAFDTYGRRMATCSGDRTVKVWELSDPQPSSSNSSSFQQQQQSQGGGASASAGTSASGGEWILSASWQAHRGSVSALCWAHPEFGVLLATAGNDQEAKIWEERSPTFIGYGGGGGAPNTSNGLGGVAGAGAGAGAVTASATTSISTTASSTANPTTSSSNSNSRWTLRASLTEARRAVTSVEFAPRHWGLKLAVGSADGAVRIYEAVDIMNLSQWPLAATLQPFVDTLPPYDSVHEDTSSWLQKSVTSLSWCTARFEPPTLVVAGSGGGSGSSSQQQQQTQHQYQLYPSLVVYRYSEAARAWQPLLQLGNNNPTTTPSPTIGITTAPGSGGGGAVLCTAWAPNVGRRFHYIAAAQGDTLQVYKLLRKTTISTGPTTTAPASANPNRPPSHPSTNTTTSNTTTTPNTTPQQTLVLESVQTIPVNAWRCQWNVTGTVLACSGEGGVVHLYKANLDGQFLCVSKVQQQQQSQQSQQYQQQQYQQQQQGTAASSLSAWMVED